MLLLAYYSFLCVLERRFFPDLMMQSCVVINLLEVKRSLGKEEFLHYLISVCVGGGGVRGVNAFFSGYHGLVCVL